MRSRGWGRPTFAAPLACAVAGIFAGGCVTSSGRDLARIRDLTGLPLPRALDGGVSGEVPEEVKQILARPLDADAAVRAALLGNRDLRATLRSLGVERGLLLQSSLLPNPQVEVEIAPERNTEIAVRIEFDLTDALLTPLRRGAAEADLEAARLHAAGEVLVLAFEVRVAFYDVVASEERLRVGQRALETHAAARDAARALQAAGNVANLQLALHEAAYEDARLGVATLELGRTRARERLHRLLGLSGELTSWTTKGGLPELPAAPPPFDKLETMAVEKSLDLAELRSKMKGHAKRADLARASKLVPDASVDLHVLAGGDGGGATPPAPIVGAGIRVRVPLFDQGQGHAGAHQARFDAELERYFGVAVRVRSGAREVRAELEAAFARARHIETVLLPARRKVVKETILQANAMQVGVFQVLAARRAELDAEMAKIEATRAYVAAAAGLETLLAGKRPPRGSSAAEGAPMAGKAIDGGH